MSDYAFGDFDLDPTQTQALVDCYCDYPGCDEGYTLILPADEADRYTLPARWGRFVLQLGDPDDAYAFDLCPMHIRAEVREWMVQDVMADNIIIPINGRGKKVLSHRTNGMNGGVQPIADLLTLSSVALDLAAEAGHKDDESLVDSEDDYGDEEADGQFRIAASSGFDLEDINLG